MDSLECINISKSFDSLRVLKNISFKILPGQFVSLIGPSGCGKSTLLRIFAGVDTQTVGEVLFSGKKIADLRGMSGYMPQKPLLLPWRNVEENVVLGADIKGESRNKEIVRARTLLKEFGLGDFIKVSPQILSGGMRQKVALLRTVLFNSKLLLLDEPFGALDALTRLSLQFWLMELWVKHRSAVLFVTHDIREAILLSDRILVMSERPGKIIADMYVDLSRPRRREQLISKKALCLEHDLFNLLFSKDKQINNLTIKQ